MGFSEIEDRGKRLLERHPGLKKKAKRVYQKSSCAFSREKIIAQGDIRCVSPADGFEYFYGYYDKSPWSADDRFLLCMRAENTWAEPAPSRPAEILLIDTQNGNEVCEIGESHAWNVQQGCMAQWLGPDFQSRIIYNDFRGGSYCSVIYDVYLNREERVLPLPVYDAARDAGCALSLDFSRLHRLRPGYGYANLPEITAGERCPDMPCIWKMDLQTGETKPLLKYTDLAGFEPDSTMKSAEHKVNHLMISPNGKRFMALHRWFDNGRKHTRLVTADMDGSHLYNLSDDVFVSHCFWKNDEEILSFLRKKETGNHYYLMKDQTREWRMYWPKLGSDGHCSYSPDGRFVITDTYPNRKRVASVYLCTEGGDEYGLIERIARVYSPFRYDNDCRCDLHPRWNRAGTEICIDSVHEGHRGLYVLPLGRRVI